MLNEKQSINYFWSCIFLSILFLVVFTELGRTIGIRNYGIGKVNGQCMCYFTLEGVYDKRILIEVLDSYEIFDYRLIGTRLVKTGKKSYDIQENQTSQETSSLLSVRVDRNCSDYTLRITFDHGVFDMQYVMEIIDAYLRKDSSPKPLQISKSVYLSDILVFGNYLPSRDDVKRDKIIVTMETVKAYREPGLSCLDIVFATLAHKYLMDAGKTSCVVCITKSTRTTPDRYRVGNMVTFHNVAITRGTIKDIAHRIRKSYVSGTTFAPADILITSWVPNKSLTHLYTTLKTNGDVDCGGVKKNRVHRNIYRQEIIVSMTHGNYLCDIHWKGGRVGL
jgi:hypothetical protein